MEQTSTLILMGPPSTQPSGRDGDVVQDQDDSPDSGSEATTVAFAGGDDNDSDRRLSDEPDGSLPERLRLDREMRRERDYADPSSLMVFGGAPTRHGSCGSAPVRLGARPALASVSGVPHDPPPPYTRNRGSSYSGDVPIIVYLLLTTLVVLVMILILLMVIALK
ncbi:membrane protein UL56 [Psittacid alphaherpesvirus 1]|uniref:membrane protein UL56 n=1 Tax=Psittacid alphaherpesvirus 1 TaxID=50294 RepID=UPI0001536819|nr:membrane protein UL56 [Psittacid alphaherpesvirus 1]